MDKFLRQTLLTRDRMMVAAGVVWSLFVFLSLIWNWHAIGDSLMTLAISDARTSYQKDLVYRRWVTLQGGVYVPPTEKTPPNPYLAGIPDQNVVTTDGKQLTLINPAYMTRQVQELGAEQYGLMGHLTSLTPIRPGNAPDDWEITALRSIETGAMEAVSVETIDAKPYLRLMRALTTEAGCLKCHGNQGFREGDIQGGISVSVPLASYYAVADRQRLLMTLAHLVIWFMGIIGVAGGNKLLRNQMVFLEKHADESARMVQELETQRAELQKNEADTTRILQELSDYTAEIEMQNEELLRIQEDLNASRSRYFDLYDLAPVGYMTVSENGFILEANLTASVQMGVVRGALINQSVLKYIHREDQGIYYFLSKTLFKSGGWQAFELRMVRSDSRTFWAGLDATVVQDKNGETVCRVVIRDLTDRKSAETERIARKAAEEANRSKSIFLANMSHEIRTPMNAMMGFAHVLGSDPSLTPKQAEHVGVILRSGNHLLRLINDILDMSRIDADQMSLTLEEFRLIDLIREVEMLFRETASVKGLGFVLEFAHHDLPNVHADMGKLRQILINLLGNAMKFTMAGQIALRVKGTMLEAGEVVPKLHLIIEVEDTGPGISEENMFKVFDMFYQVSQGAPTGGTGLGLSISRKYAQLMGGDITVRSQVGTGSCFRLEVLLETVQTALPDVGRPKKIVGVVSETGPWRILVVDDVADNLALMTALLTPVGFQVQEAANGVEALEIFHEWLPHAVLLDMRMPVMDGYETVRRIKSTDVGQRVLVVAVSAGAFQNSRNKAMEAGADAYLAKPFITQELFDILKNGLGLRYIFSDGTGREASGGVSPARTPTPSDAPARLLPATAQAILKAVSEGDMIQLIQLIDAAEFEDSQAAWKLRDMAGSFDYLGIREFLEKI